MKITIDTREPWPHPWAEYFPEGTTLERATLDTGDLTLTALDDGATIERKTVPDFVAAVGSQRERFERELARSRHLAAFCIIVEGDLRDVCTQARGVSIASIYGTVAAWNPRFCPILFAGNAASAADLAHRYLASQIRDIQRSAKAIR